MKPKLKLFLLQSLLQAGYLTFIMVSYAFLSFSVLYVSTLSHERVHKQIMEHFGCENVTIEMNVFGTSTTRGLCSLSESERLGYNALSVENDIYGYQIDSLLGVIVGGFLITNVIIVLVFGGERK